MKKVTNKPMWTWDGLSREVKKKLYICINVENECLAVVTRNRKLAVKWFWDNRDDIGMSDCTFIEFKEQSSIKWKKWVDVSSLEFWVIDAKRAVLNWVYYSTEGLCEKCWRRTDLYLADKWGFLCCVKCDN